MIQVLRRKAGIYGAFAVLQPKLFMAYSIWVWTGLFLQVVAMVIFVYFWRAVYSGTSTVGGLTLQQTLNYILLAQILMPLVVTRLILNFGFLVREGMVGIELLRPVDFEGRYFIEQLTSLGIDILFKLPLLGVAWLFGLRLPSNPAVWGTFLVSLLIGYCVIFCFDWIFACLAFYSTETWGLSVVREGLAVFFSGGLIPLVMMPHWLQDIAAALPFSQALYVPVSLLSGNIPLSQAPRLLAIQFAWFIGLGLLSRIAFTLAARKVTVQGG